MRITPTSTWAAPSIKAIEVSTASPPSKVPPLVASRAEYIDEVVALSTPLRLFLWCTILFIVLANATLLAIFAYEYTQNETNDSFLWLFRILVAVALYFVWTSTSKRRLGFGSRKVSRRTFSSTRLMSALERPATVWRKIMRLYAQWHHAFSVRGPYFDLRLLAEEAFEIIGQTVAAYTSSHSISNVPLNLIYAGVIFLNSISAFVFRRVFRTSLVKQRLECLMVDLVLDFIWGTLLPIWMYAPIVKVYLDRAHVITYLETFPNSTREIERVLILSWKNYILSIVPFCNSLINLLELQGILREMSRPPVTATSTADEDTAFVQLRYPAGRQRHGFFIKLAHNALPLADLHIYSCPGLEMPSKIHAFKNLMSIVIKDSTLVSWDERAFLDDAVFHELRTFQLFNIVVQDDPIGLTVRMPIAKSVEWIHLENIDGVRLLSLVGDHWRGVLFFDCMGCGVTTVPDALNHTPQLTMSSLEINDFTSIPDDWIPRSNAQLQMIWFDVNFQLSELPDSLWRQAATCGVFSMTYTNLSTVPEWVADIAGPDFLLTAAGTPICADGAVLSPRIQNLVSCVRI